MLSCREVTEQATEYLEGDLSFWRRLVIRLHLGMCRHCQEFVRQIELTAAALGTGAVDPAPAAGPDEALMAAFQSEFGGGGGDDS